MRLFFLRTAGATTLFFLVTITIFYFGKDLFKNGNTIGASSSVEKAKSVVWLQFTLDN
jgi:hypothetical protein